jgi:hypothetical protein
MTKKSTIPPKSSAAVAASNPAPASRAIAVPTAPAAQVRMSPAKQTKPNPAQFLKRSSSAASSRPTGGPDKAVRGSVNHNKMNNRGSVLVNKARGGGVSAAHNKIASASALESQNNPKPFKARPVPNFSKIHKSIFNIDKSVVHMVKENNNKQNAVGDKMTKAMSNALSAPMVSSTSTTPQKNQPHRVKPRTPLGQLSTN